MIDALCEGKLSRDVEGMEDLLTSAVFGRLRYLPPEEGLIPFLSGAKYPDRSAVLPSNLRAKEVRYQFWPWWQFGDSVGAEPDVVVELVADEGRIFRVLVEAKFRSFKSSEADSESVVPIDQLAREWQNLSHVCERDGATPLMIYLTVDFAIPRNEIEQSAAEFSEKCPACIHPFRCGWLSWRYLPIALRNIGGPIASDIVRLVERHHLTPFNGISKLDSLIANWRFAISKSTFDFRRIASKTWSWSFAHGK